MNNNLVTPRVQVKMRPEQSLFTCSHAFLVADFAYSEEFEAGIISDQDPEFLHQYRVCLRRMRAILSLLKAVFPSEQHKLVTAQLKMLMQKTNLLRDLDVYLLTRARLCKSLKPKHQRGLAVFFNDIEARRAVEFEHVADWLTCSAYQQQRQAIQTNIEAMQGHVTPQLTALSCSGYAHHVICKHQQKVVKWATAMTVHSDDQQIHHLRILCKKLRYLLEYFAPILDRDNYQKQLKSLKRLQNCLGNFNDSSVQYQLLSSYLPTSNPSSRCYKALAKLLSLCKHQHQQDKTKIIQQLSRFLAAQRQLSKQSLGGS